jgi:4-amino-4-deoxy-L-arabinose transferase-like glycosyltransferase
VTPPLLLDPRDDRLTPATLAAATATVLLAAGLRLFRLDQEGLWYDELVMARLTSGPWSDVWAETLRGRPPLYVMLGWLWTHLVGSGDAAIRTLSVALGVAAVAMTFIVGRLMLGTRIALWAALFAACSPFQIYYSQEHRYYALLALTALLCLWTLMRGMRSGRSAWFVGFGFACALVFYTHVVAVTALVAIGVGVLLAWRHWPHHVPRGFWLGCAIALGLALPRIALEVAQQVQPQALSGIESPAPSVYWLAPPPWWAPIRTGGNFLLLGFRYVPVAAAVAIVVVGAAVVLIRRRTLPWRDVLSTGEAIHQRHRAELTLLLSLLIVPVVLLMAISYVVKPAYVDRYLMPSATAWYLLLAAGVAAARPVVPPWVAAGAILVAMAGANVTYFTVPSREGWRETSAWLDRHMSEDDVVFYTSERGDAYETHMTGGNLNWYMRTRPTMLPLHLTVPANRVLDALTKAKPDSGRSWIVLWEDHERDRKLDALLTSAAAAEAGVRLVEEQEFLTLRVYRLHVTSPQPPPHAR